MIITCIVPLVVSVVALAGAVSCLLYATRLSKDANAALDDAKATRMEAEREWQRLLDTLRALERARGLR